MRKGLPQLAVDELNATAASTAVRSRSSSTYDPAGDANQGGRPDPPPDRPRRRRRGRRRRQPVRRASALAMQAAAAARRQAVPMATEGAREIVQPADERPTTWLPSRPSTTRSCGSGPPIWRSARRQASAPFLPDTSGFGESAKAELGRRSRRRRHRGRQSEGFDPTATNLTPQLTNLRRGVAPAGLPDVDDDAGRATTWSSRTRGSSGSTRPAAARLWLGRTAPGASSSRPAPRCARGALPAVGRASCRSTTDCRTATRRKALIAGSPTPTRRGRRGRSERLRRAGLRRRAADRAGDQSVRQRPAPAERSRARWRPQLHQGVNGD